MNTTKLFKIAPHQALEGAMRARLSAVAIVGVDHDGEVIVFSSESTPLTLALFNRVPSHLEEIRNAA
jgi:hypothetical protein